MIFRFPTECRSRQILAAFTRWDAAHFLNVAGDGWDQHEYSHAFFPMFPLMIRWLAHALAPLFASSLCVDELRVVIGVFLSNAAFVVAACCLHALSLRILRDPLVARTAARIFCVAPASVFFSTLYAESSFAASTFAGLLLLERGAPWAASLVLAFATGCRANGVMNVVPMAYMGVRRLSKVLDGYDSDAWRQAGCALGVAMSCVVQCALILAPYVGWQTVGYHRVCDFAGKKSASPPRSSAAAADLAFAPTRIARTAADSCLPADWCEQRLPDLYAHVQSQYWGVGLFQYYTWWQLPNFALAAPALLLCAGATFETVRLLRARCARARRACKASDGHRVILCATLREALGLGCCKRREVDTATGGGSLAPRTLIYVVQWASLSALALLVANVQTTTRLVGAASPPVYWFMAHLLLRRGGLGFASERLRTYTLGYIALFALAGTAAHSNYMPWT